MPKQNRQPGIHLHKTKELVASGRSQPDIYEDRWYWILIAKNGKTIARSSETYRSKRAAVKSIKIVELWFVEHNHYYDHTTDTGKVKPDLVVY